MDDLQDRLDELHELGLGRRARMISGPQGPRVVLDGKPVLLLCSNNALGLADHPRVREAAAEAAMRWGVGAGAARGSSGTMTLHRRLEDQLADFHGTESALLFGSGYLAGIGVVGALARPGDTIFSDALNHAALVDGCRLSGAEVFVYDHADPDHLAWGLRQHPSRGSLIVTDAVFAADGDIAPLEDLAELAHRHGARLVVDEAHAIGTLGPGGRGAASEADIDADVLIGSLAKALGSYGAYAACDAPTARLLAGAARTHTYSTAPAPPLVAGALAALDLLVEQPRRVEKLGANAGVLHDELAREGFDMAGSSTHIIPLVVGDPADALAMSEAALAQGVFAQTVCPPAVPAGTARLRLSVMASHTRSELVEAAHVLGRAALLAGLRPGTMVPVAEAQAGGEVVPLRRAA